MPVRLSTRKKATKAPVIIGKVVHYYDKIGVAIVELASKVALGDHVLFKRGDFEHMQTVESLQKDHEDVSSAKKGDTVGVYVGAKMHEGTWVLPV